jgi:maleylacetate reductase
VSEAFVYEALPMRVRFGAGSVAALPDEVGRLGLESVLLLCSPGRQASTARVAEALGERCAGLFAEARMHVPAELARRARARADELRCDGFVAVGGGSALGLGKAIALTSGLPILAVPTTYAGSEMSTLWGLTEHGEKRTGRDRRVLPASVIYDPELTLTLPAAVSVTSGINAIAHAAESLYAPDRSPIIELMAAAGIRLIAGALPAIVRDGTDLAARTAALQGAWLSGGCLGATTMGLHHRLCHVLGGALDLPHAATHTVVLPHVLAWNLTSAPQAESVLATVLGPQPALALWRLAGTLGGPRSLRELGMAEHDIHRVVQDVLARPVDTPRPLTAAALTELLRDAWAGTAPA